MKRRVILELMTGSAVATLLPDHAFAAIKADMIATPKEAVTGIGGFFFRAKNPRMLAQWYQDHLGVLMSPQKEGDKAWEQQAGETAFTPFQETTKYFGPDMSKQWMLNFRVRDMDKMIAQLRDAGIAAEINPDASFGKFARIHDPEGNPIELWQPM